MAVEGYKHTNFETSDDADDESKDTSKSKKKVESKKESVADRGKDIWGKILGDRKDEAVDAVASDEITAETTEEHSEDASAEAENNLALEVLTIEEEAAITKMYAEARLAELEEGRSEDEDPADAAAREANIVYIHTILAESEVAELEAENIEPTAEVTSETREAKSFDPDEAVQINTRPAEPPRPTAGEARESLTGGSVWENSENPAPARTEYQPAARNNKMGNMLLGGAIGYLIGRRRGRIKTEKRLVAVQQKLERQVEAVQESILQREASVQKLARENYQLRQEARPAATVAAVRAERPYPEHTDATQPERPTTLIHTETSPRIEGLSRDQLLEASSQVRFGETNLRRVYEAQLVDEAGLRRLMHEAEAGNDLRRALAREFLVKELRFERDPRMKGNSADAGGATGAGTAFASTTTATALNQPSQTQPTAQPTTSSAQPLQAPKQRRQTDVSPAALIVLTVFTLALAVYAIWLTITR